MSIGDRIKELRMKSGMTQEEAGKYIGISKQNLYKYENGIIENIPSDKIEKMAELYRVSPSYIMGWEDEKGNLSLKNIMPIHKQKIPLIGRIAAGAPIYADEVHESYAIYDGKDHVDFALKVQGDSMIGARINDGDIVFIRQQDEVENGEIAAVIIDDSATLKRFRRSGDTVLLIPENPKYAPMVFGSGSCDQFKIIGKAVFFQSDLE